MTLKYPKYHAEAQDKNVEACITAIRSLYDLYSKWDIAEAHVQIRRDLDLVPEITTKTKTKRASNLENKSIQKQDSTAAPE